MLTIYQLPTKWAQPAVSAWCATHDMCAHRRYVDEDSALTAVCERIRELAIITRTEPDLEAHRSASGAITVRALGVTYVVRPC